MQIVATDRPILFVASHNGSVTVAGVTRVGETTVSQNLVSADDENALLGAVASAGVSAPPVPAQGEKVQAWQVYDHDGTLVMAQISHTRTHHDIADLIGREFLVYQPDSAGVEWVAGVPVVAGMERVFDGVTYRCIQPHTTQFTPDLTPALWEVVADSDEWQAGVAYTIGDIVTYNGSQYECLQSHTSQVGWKPPNVPALWLAL